MPALLGLAAAMAVFVVFGAKLLLVAGLLISCATFAFPLGLIALVAIGVGLTWFSQHRPSHWGQPE